MTPLQKLRTKTKDTLIASRFRGLKTGDKDFRSLKDATVIGLFRSVSGIGKGARLIYDGLDALGLDPQFVDVTSLFYGNFDQKCKLPEKRPTITESSVLIFQINPPEILSVFNALGEDFLRDKYRIGIWAWEQDKLPRNWIKTQKYFDELWASSDYLQGVFSQNLKTSSRKFVYPMALGTLGASGHVETSAPDNTSPEKPFRFFSSFDNRSCLFRKNPMGVIQAFKAAFPDSNENVRLTVKVTGINRVSELPQDLLKAANDPRIELRVDHLSQAEYVQLFMKIDCVVSLARSEGFGFLPAESTIRGIPLIYSDIPAFKLYADCPVAFAVPGKPVGIKGRTDLYDAKYGGWADPDINQAASAMQHVIAVKPERSAGTHWAQSVFGLDRFKNDITTQPGG